MENTQCMPLFFSSQLFDLLKINQQKRATARPKIEYLRLQKEDIQALTMAKISQEGIFCDLLRYVQFDFKFGFLLCVFDDNKKCCRAYQFYNGQAN